MLYKHTWTNQMSKPELRPSPAPPHNGGRHPYLKGRLENSRSGEEHAQRRAQWMALRGMWRLRGPVSEPRIPHGPLPHTLGASGVQSGSIPQWKAAAWGSTPTAITGEEEARMADPFLTQVWRDLLPPLGLGHLHFQGPTGESLTPAPPCLVSQQSDLRSHAPQQETATPRVTTSPASEKRWRPPAARPLTASAWPAP